MNKSCFPKMLLSQSDKVENSKAIVYKKPERKATTQIRDRDYQRDTVKAQRHI